MRTDERILIDQINRATFPLINDPSFIHSKLLIEKPKEIKGQRFQIGLNFTDR